MQHISYHLFEYHLICWHLARLLYYNLNLLQSLFFVPQWKLTALQVDHLVGQITHQVASRIHKSLSSIVGFCVCVCVLILVQRTATYLSLCKGWTSRNHWGGRHLNFGGEGGSLYPALWLACLITKASTIFATALSSDPIRLILWPSLKFWEMSRLD